MPTLGGRRITLVRWIGPTEVEVRFESDGLTRTQLYAGRTLIGITQSSADRIIYGQLREELWPYHLTLVAVTDDEALEDWGDLLPVRPYHRAAATVAVTDPAGEAQQLLLYGAPLPGGEVDESEPLDVAIIEGTGDYRLLSPPRPGSGLWKFRLMIYDRRPPEGNPSVGVDFEIDLVATPPDIAADAEGRRLRDLSVTAQSLQMTCEIP